MVQVTVTLPFGESSTTVVYMLCCVYARRDQIDGAGHFHCNNHCWVFGSYVIAVCMTRGIRLVVQVTLS